jgi:hypothetical protein
LDECVREGRLVLDPRLFVVQEGDTRMGLRAWREAASALTFKVTPGRWWQKPRIEDASDPAAVAALIAPHLGDLTSWLSLEVAPRSVTLSMDWGSLDRKRLEAAANVVLRLAQRRDAIYR